MTYKKLIKQEIERKIENILKEYKESNDPQFTLIGKIDSLEELLLFINSLPEESASEGLEREIERCWKEMFPIGWSDTTLLALTHEEHAAFARHFAEWQKQKTMQDFLEKAEEFFNEQLNIHPHDCHVIQYVSDTSLEDIDDFVKQFKNYMQNEM